MTTTSPGPTPTVPPATAALRAQAARQRGGYVYAIDPYFDPDGAVPPYGIVGGWSVDEAGQLVTFSHNPNYRPSPVALEFPAPPQLWTPPCTAPSPTMPRRRNSSPPSARPRSCSSRRRACTRSQRTTAAVTSLPSPTRPTPPTPGTWHLAPGTTGDQLAAAGVPVRLNPGHRISLTIPGDALRS